MILKKPEILIEADQKTTFVKTLQIKKQRYEIKQFTPLSDFRFAHLINKNDNNYILYKPSR